MLPCSFLALDVGHFIEGKLSAKRWLGLYVLEIVSYPLGFSVLMSVKMATKTSGYVAVQNSYTVS